MAQPETNWRTEILREERVKVCQHIMRKLAMYYSSTPEASLKQKTRNFENQAYSLANSREEYLQKIAQGLSNIERRVQQSQANQAAIASLHQHANPANAQAQAAMREQLRQHQENMRQRQLLAAHQQQQQQLQLQAQQVLMQQQHANSVKQQHDPTRKPPAAAKRAQPTNPDPKAKGASVAAGKPSTTAAQNASIPKRGKGGSANGHAPAGASAEELRRKAQMNGKQVPFHPGQSQNPANGAGVSNEYLMALARQQQSQLPSASQPQPHGPGQNPQQSQNGGQTQPQLPPGSVVPGVLTTQQQILQQQQAGHPSNGAASAHRASQGMLHQGLARTGLVVQDGMMVDSQAKVESRRARAEAAVAAAAAIAGFKFTPEEIRGLSPEQVRQILHVASQRNNAFNGGAMQTSMPLNRHVPMGDAQTSANSNASRGAATNMANWIGSFGNAAAPGGNGQVNLGQNHLSQALALQERKQLQQARLQHLQQGNGSQANVAAAPGKRDSNSAPTNPAGVTVPQMNAILAREKVKMEKPGSSPQDKKAAIAEALQDANRGRTSQAIRSTAPGHVPGGPAVTAGVASARAPAGQRGAVPASGSDEEFWTKLEDMQRKYRYSLQKLLPIIRRLQDRQEPDKRELFMTHLKDAFNILNMPRSSPIPPRLTLTVLERAERFILQVVSVHSKYVREMVQRSDPTRGQVPVGTQQGAGVPSQPPSHMPTERQGQPVKGESRLPRGTASQLDMRRQQQYALIHQQQLQQQKMQQLFIMKRPPAGVQQTPHLQQGHPQGALSSSASDPSKTVVKTSSAKTSGSRSRGNEKISRGSQGLPISRAMSGVMSGQQQMQAPTQAHEQGQVVAVAQQQAQAVVQAQAAAARAQLQSQAAQAQAQAQLLAAAQAKSQRLHELRTHPHQTVRGQQPRVQQNLDLRQPPVQQTRLGTQGAMTNGMSQQIPQWGAPQISGTSAVGSNLPGAVPDATRPKRAELTIQQRLQVVDATVKEAVEHSQRLESLIDMEMKRDKSERIQTTLAALRNNSSTAPGEGDQARGTKRQISLVDVDNYGPKDGVIKSKTVFECSSEAGLRLAKRPKNEAADLRSLREAVEADCKAAKERNPLLMIDIMEEFGLPVVSCLLRIPEIRLPKLVLRVQRGYPRKGGATYGFERPPMGWIGVLDEIRTRFKQALATAPAASVGVAAFLDAWATEADNVINGSCLSESG